MRNTITHEWSENVQPHPEDNTSQYVNAQIAEWRKTGVLVHPQIALEVASWWAAPTAYGVDFMLFAQAGIITDDLRDAIDIEIQECVNCLYEADHTCVDCCQASIEEHADGLNALHALRAYVLGAKVTPWRVGHNMAGYLPEATVYAFLDYADAHAQFEQNLEELRDFFGEQTDEHEEGCDCEECSAYNFVNADLERYQTLPSRRGDLEPELSESYQISGHRVDVYWLTKGEPATYADYLKAKDDE